MEKKVNNNLCLNIDVDDNNNNNNNKNKKKNIKKRNYKQTFYYNQNKIIKNDSNDFNDPLFNLIFKKKAKKSYDETFSLSDKSIETQMTQSDEDQKKCKNENNDENNF